MNKSLQVTTGHLVALFNFTSWRWSPLIWSIGSFEEVKASLAPNWFVYQGSEPWWGDLGVLMGYAGLQEGHVYM